MNLMIFLRKWKEYMENSKIKQLKLDFKQYLIRSYPNIANTTIQTYLRDAFYVYRHNSEFNIDFFDLFKNRQTIDTFEKELFDNQKSKSNIIYPKSSTKAYMNGLYRLYNFFEDVYGGINNFINSKILQ